MEHLSESRELNFFLVPFLSGKLPQQMKVNAADLLRQLLSKSDGVDRLRHESGQPEESLDEVQGPALAVDFDGMCR